MYRKITYNINRLSTNDNTETANNLQEVFTDSNNLTQFIEVIIDTKK